MIIEIHIGYFAISVSEGCLSSSLGEGNVWVLYELFTGWIWVVVMRDV